MPSEDGIGYTHHRNAVASPFRASLCWNSVHCHLLSTTTPADNHPMDPYRSRVVVCVSGYVNLYRRLSAFVGGIRVRGNSALYTANTTVAGCSWGFRGFEYLMEYTLPVL